MGWVAELKYKLLEMAFKEDEKSYLVFDKWYPRVKNFIWSVGTFMGALYVFFKVLGRIGFERTLIILLVSVTVYLRSWLKAVAYGKK